MDTAIRNLLWDKERKKWLVVLLLSSLGAGFDWSFSYILDFEIFRKPTDMDVWDDSLYLAWNLAWVSDGDPNDMETWEL